MIFPKPEIDELDSASRAQGLRAAVRQQALRSRSGEGHVRLSFLFYSRRSHVVRISCFLKDHYCRISWAKADVQYEKRRWTHALNPVWFARPTRRCSLRSRSGEASWLSVISLSSCLFHCVELVSIDGCPLLTPKEGLYQGTRQYIREVGRLVASLKRENWSRKSSSGAYQQEEEERQSHYKYLRLVTQTSWLTTGHETVTALNHHACTALKD